MRYISIVALLVMLSCKDARKTEKDKIKKADWLIGSWEQKTGHGTMTESWTRTNDSTFNGESYFIKEKDTLDSETIVLSQRGNLLTYSPTVKGQNGDKAVDFKLTSATASQLVFENPKHDFPQRITYRKVTADSIVASISGIEHGKPAGESYPMRRQPAN